MTARAFATSVVLLAAALGCAGAPPRPSEPARPQSAEAAPAKSSPKASAAASGAEPAAAGTLPPRAQRLFEEAVRAEEEQRKLSTPPDLGYLERKWRAATEAGEIAEAHHNLGVALEEQGRLGDARAQYERARELKPGLRQAAVNLAVVLEKQGDVRAAAAAYAQCIRDFPDEGMARARLAALYRSSGQLDEAWRLAREALARDPRMVAAYKVLARVALDRNELDLAKLVALRAQKLDGRDPELPFTVGQVLARQGDDAGAQAQFRRALSLADRFLPARHALLEAALRKRAWGAVAEHARAILDVDSSNAAVHLVLGLALRYTGKPDDALAAYERAEKASGDRLPEVHLARGVLLARVKADCEPALAALRTYQSRAGPVAPEGAQVGKLQRECEAQLEENRKALEAAKEMQAEAARQAAEKSGGVQNPATPPAEGRAAPPPAPHPGR